MDVKPSLVEIECVNCRRKFTAQRGIEVVGCTHCRFSNRIKYARKEDDVTRKAADRSSS